MPASSLDQLECARPVGFARAVLAWLLVFLMGFGQPLAMVAQASIPTQSRFLGRTTDTTPNTAPGAGTPLSFTEYDGLGRVWKSYSADQLDPASPSYGRFTAFGYDAAGRRVTVRDALGQLSRSQYDENG